MGLLKKLLPFSGILIFIFIIWKEINLKSVITVIEHANIAFLLPALLATFFIIFFKIIRIFRVLRENNISITFLQFLKIYANTNILAQATNLLFSETTAAIATMHNQNKKTRVANIYMLCNVTDFSTISLLCLISFLINFNLLKQIINFNFNNNIHTPTIMLIIFLVLFILLIIFYNKIINLIKHIISDLKTLVSNSYKTIIPYTAIIYFFYILACYFDAEIFNIKIDLSYLLLIYTLGSLISVVPISINGLGTREAAILFLLNFKGISSESAFSLSLFAFVFAPLLIYVLIYIYVLIKEVKFKS